MLVNPLFDEAVDAGCLIAGSLAPPVAEGLSWSCHALL